MGSDGVEFVREIRLNEGDLFWNRISHQIMLEGVVVKQEDISDEIKYPVTENIAEEHPKPMPKVIQHRRRARISKLNSVAIRRHIVLRRTQPIEVTQDDVNQSSTSSDLSEGQMAAKRPNEGIVLTPTAPKETMADRKDVNSIHGEMEGNDFSQIRDSINSRTLHVMPCAKASQTYMESRIIGSMQTNDAGNPQIADAEKGNDTRTLTFDPMDMEVAQFLQIESNDSASSAIRHIILNRCEACVQTFKTPKNLANHLQSKKHEKKMMRLGKRK